MHTRLSENCILSFWPRSCSAKRGKACPESFRFSTEGLSPLLKDSRQAGMTFEVSLGSIIENESKKKRIIKESSLCGIN